MKLAELPSLAGGRKRAKRRGRGYGSGRGGHTVGRGSKGQKARGRVRAYFEGGQLPLIRRLPHLRGFKRLRTKEVTVRLGRLNRFREGEVVTPETLAEKGLVPRSTVGVKIVRGGTLKRKLTIKSCRLSGAAREEVEALGGQTE